ncbi:Transcriptional regulator PerR [bacterium HR32]|jgi:Fur family peroxide stress response transcriptional regulator|nr:Transcriptional regulator PerR [bacterium HR32]
MRMNLDSGHLAALRERLARAGHRLTPQRWAVWAVLQRLGDHPSAEGLYRAVRRRHPMVSRATVYKTLEVLVRVGLVAPLPTADGVTRFDAGGPHVNFECLRCGRIEDAHDPTSLLALDRLARRVGFAAYPAVVVRGVCQRCRTGSGVARGTRLRARNPQGRV